MIPIKRSSVPESFHLFVESIYQRSGGELTSRRRVPYPPLIRALLVDEFLNKCGYCESPLGLTETGSIDTFRPVSLYGEEARMDWHNLVLSCAICNRNKGGAFPLVPLSSLADPGFPYRLRVDAEVPMLLNPGVDEPSLHLGYEVTGRVIGLSERGMATIETLDLNRGALLHMRAVELRRFMEAHQEEKLYLLQAERPYLAIKQMFLQRDEGLSARIESASQQQSSLDQQRENVGTDIGQGLDDYKARPRYIELIHLKNIGAIANLTLDLRAEKSERTPCFAMVGINGVGKSTVLKAVATALAGEPYAKQLGIGSNTLLADGATDGSITLHITGYSEPLTLKLRRGKKLDFSHRHSRALVLGYGATRLMASGRRRARLGVKHAKLDNLFDPFLPVSDPAAFLDRQEAHRIEHVRATVDSLLNAEGGENGAVIVEGKIRIRVGGGPPRPMAELSDGYKALIAMATDIIDVMHRAEYADMNEAKGIVLMDELGNHFHPAWKLRIVSALRQAFPRIQFIFSTHEPLCLRGLVEGEVAVLERDAEGVYLLTDLPAVESLRVDQLLTSEHFGMASTLDPSMNDKIERYHLLVRDTERTAAADLELQSLETELAATKYLGNSQRERMLLKLLDISLEPLPRMPGANISVEQVSARSLNRLNDILHAVSDFNPEVMDHQGRS